MTWQAITAFLACASIGAVHFVVFAGFSAEALCDRINDCKSRVIFTGVEGHRGGKTIATKGYCRPGAQGLPTHRARPCSQRTGNEDPWTQGRDKRWHEETVRVPNYCPPELMSVEDPFFILCEILACTAVGTLLNSPFFKSSGSTDKPKGVVLYIRQSGTFSV
jgi:acetyl-CoA synthetase